MQGGPSRLWLFREEGFAEDKPKGTVDCAEDISMLMNVVRYRRAEGEKRWSSSALIALCPSDMAQSSFQSGLSSNSNERGFLL